MDYTLWYLCTMLGKKALSSPSDEQNIRRELEYLYHRRSAVEMLIRSLEQYDRFRSQGETRNHKPA